MSESAVLWLAGMCITGMAAFVSGVVWAVRLEARVAAMAREIDQLRADLTDNVRYIRDRIDKVWGPAR